MLKSRAGRRATEKTKLAGKRHCPLEVVERKERNETETANNIDIRAGSGRKHSGAACITRRGSHSSHRAVDGCTMPGLARITDSGNLSIRNVGAIYPCITKEELCGSRSQRR